MAGGRGVTCPECGGSTPLPEDLTAPSFVCGYCATTLSTAAFAGQAAVSADALLDHVRQIAADPSGWRERVAESPRFEGSSEGTRPSRCLHCEAEVAVPLAIDVHWLRCPSCGKDQPVAEHISDRERFELDMARQVAGNEAYKRLLAEGLACPRCGAHNRVEDEGTVQRTCAHCGTTILLSDFVDESAIARYRIKQGMASVKEQLVAEHTRRERTKGLAILALVAAFVIAGVIVNLMRD